VPREIAELLDGVEDLIAMYVVLTDEQRAAVTVWTAHTHAIEAAEATGYLHANSPERESGKSRLLETLEHLVRDPLLTMNTSEAALFRTLAERPRTLLFDEVDSIFGDKQRREHEELRALLNAGHRRGATVTRCVGEGSKQRVQEFPVFGAKILAGIGQLPETIASRCIAIQMQRKSRDEVVARFRLREVRAESEPLRTGLAEWASRAVPALSDARPALPDELSDRAQDSWEGLLAIADAAGGDWPDRARNAAIGLAAGSIEQATSEGAELLAAIRGAFDNHHDADKITTNGLILALASAPESPYTGWVDGDLPQSWAPRHLAGKLKAYAISPGQVWIDGENHRGYTRHDFEDAWNRWIPTLPNASPNGKSPHQQPALTDLTHLTEKERKKAVE
jgi:hypothetical protein